MTRLNQLMGQHLCPNYIKKETTLYGMICNISTDQAGVFFGRGGVMNMNGGTLIRVYL